MKTKDLLDTLLPKWDPRENLEEDVPQREIETINGITWTPIQPRLTSAKNLTDAFRIFTPGEKSPVTKTSPEIQIQPRSTDGTSNTRTVTTIGACRKPNEDDAKAGAGIYHEPNSEENIAESLPKNLPQTKPSAELYAIKLALANTPEDTELRVRTPSKMAFDFLTKGLTPLEDKDFLDVSTGKTMKEIIQTIRDRKSTTWITKIEPQDMGVEEAKQAQTLAAAGTNMPMQEEDINWGNPDFELNGMKLATLDQKTTYRAIRRRKKLKQKKRERTEQAMDLTKAQIEELFEYKPTNEGIWKAMRNKDMSKKQYHFMWMTAHDVYMVGDKWSREGNKPKAKENAECKHCFGKIESMTHILTECESPGQEEIWTLTRNVWKNRGTTPEWRTPGLGAIIGCGLARCRDNTESKASKKGTERLWRILLASAAHLIWVLRCERVLNKNNAPFTPKEIHNRWRTEIDARIDIDRRSTNKKYEKKALCVEIVRETWKNTLRHEGDLPDNWININSGVLVGIESDQITKTGRRPKRKQTQAPHS
ncbi:hypothetical protein AAF712_013560 [Marasmius tenuissimus]|uniref:Reverse transcriptase zinc-binding domain-containing protein n=1 Tax=Marasmius tenuissimus TaxID=585030 RepID=A0ABR2ZDB2_9AGAR